MQNESMLIGEHKAKGLKFANWVRTNIRKRHDEDAVFRREIVRHRWDP